MSNKLFSQDLNRFRKILKRIFAWPLFWLARQFSSSPNRQDVFASMSDLSYQIASKGNRGKKVAFTRKDKFIIFSDQHKGTGDAADDFFPARENFMAALDHYLATGYTLVNLGDCEELWENTEKAAVDFNRDILLKEAEFLHAGRYYRVFGNHDLSWKYQVPRNLYLEPVFGKRLEVCEGILLTTIHDEREYKILLTHGHQGDRRSDGNWFSTWFVAAVWTPIQRFLQLSINTISDSYELVDKHNKIMYDWSTTQPGLVLITGHTHKPVFASLDHIERLEKRLEMAVSSVDTAEVERLKAELDQRRAEYAGKRITKSMTLPSYFNTGCCCFKDGDITGIEVADEEIRLVKWKMTDGVPKRQVLEYAPLVYIWETL